MNVLALVRTASICVLALMASGCASIISGRHAEVTLDSSPSAAEVVIRDKHGKHVLTTRTPATVQLKRKDKFIWPAKYTAEFHKPGYQPKKVAINQRVNAWVAGNVVFGVVGLVGLAVDNATGAAWQPKVAAIDANLAPMANGPQMAMAQRQMPPQGMMPNGMAPNGPPIYPQGYADSYPPQMQGNMQGGPPMPQYQSNVQPASGTMYR
jgi:hypothetical protein